MTRQRLGWLGLALVVAESASATEYRRIVTADGRAIVAEVVETTGDGFLLLVPQGRILLPFEDLIDMLPATEGDFQSQRPWPVFLAVPSHRWTAAQEAVSLIPGLVVVEARNSVIATERVRAAEACGADVPCAVVALGADPRVFVLSEGASGVRAELTGSGRHREIEVDWADPRDLVAGVRETLGLMPETWQEAVVVTQPASPQPVVEATPGAPASRNDAPPEPGPAVAQITPPGPGSVGPEPGSVATLHQPALRDPWTPERRLRASLVPIPGYGAFAEGDGRRGAIALGAAVPITAAWVGVSGSVAQSPGEHAALSVGGFLVTSVLLNQLLLPR
jgi:hypothetical protein